MGDLLRRLESRGVQIRPFEEGYEFCRDLTLRIYFLQSNVPEELVRQISDAFGIARIELYFDKVERDLN